MGNYFGTDGVRGEYGKNLNFDLAFSVGNALTQIKKSPKVVVGHDTRLSADAITLALSGGVVEGGGDVTLVGTIPTAGISYLTEKFQFDYGVIITASHNPPEYNGIKVFDSTGRKLSDSQEDFLENFFESTHHCTQIGHFYFQPNLAEDYCRHLKESVEADLSGLCVCLDASNGASYKIAPSVFKSLGAKVLKVACKPDGAHINTNCGSLHIENLVKAIKKSGAQLGFAFDGDADRVIAASCDGTIFDGDKLLYILANYFKANGCLYANSVVGTSHTNSGIMVGLNRNKINLIRTDIGDKYVIEAMEKMNLVLGGEQSGHIIIRKYAQTGDGILTALKICEIIKKTGKTLGELFDAKLLSQANINMVVKDKIKVINNENLTNLINKIVSEISPAGRVLVRASGTEDKVRIMVEHPSLSTATTLAKQIQDLIEKI